MGTHTFEQIDSIASKLAAKMDRTLCLVQKEQQKHGHAPRRQSQTDANCISDQDVRLQREALIKPPSTA